MSFQPLIPISIVSLGLLILLAILAWMERRSTARWLAARLFALIILLASIAALLLRPALPATDRQSPLLLLTKNYDRQVVDSLRQTTPKLEILYTSDALPYPQAQPLTDPISLSTLAPRVTGIAGEGLPADVLEYFPEHRFQFYPAAPQPGVTAMLQEAYYEGQPNLLQGRYQTDGETVTLVLSSPSAAEDSVQLAGAAEQAFSLAFTPRSAGKWLYNLLVKDSSGAVLDLQKVPLVVTTQRHLRILILQAFPAFEIRYLKDFLAAKGHAVAVRSQVSRDKYRTEFSNLPEQALARINATLLDGFDVLLLDGAAYQALSRAELSAISQSVNAGLGVLGLINGPQAELDRWLGLGSVGREPDTISLEKNISLPAYPVQAASRHDWYPVHVSSRGHTIAAYRYEGKGRLAFQSLQESYAYWLRGDSLTYGGLWIPLLEKTARPLTSDYTLNLNSIFPHYAGVPIDFQLTTANNPVAVLADSVAVPLLEDYRIAGVWHGRSWPEHAGWHQLKAGEVQLDYYSFPTAAWPSLAVAQKKQFTQSRAVSAPAFAAAMHENTRLQPVSLLWFYLFFLLSAGFLWLAPKL